MLDNAVEKIKDLFDDLLKDKKALVKILFVVMILLLALILRINAANKSEVSIVSADTEYTENNEESEGSTPVADICVDIGGQVNEPGVYQVSEGTRLYQLIELAGGLTENADTDSINRASYVEDGEKIIIPARSSGDNGTETDGIDSSDAVSSEGISSDGIVNINLASKDELKTLNGIGDVMAERIIEYRTSNRFKRKEDIKSVKGIGDGIYEKIKDDITC